MKETENELISDDVTTLQHAAVAYAATLRRPGRPKSSDPYPFAAHQSRFRWREDVAAFALAFRALRGESWTTFLTRLVRESPEYLRWQEGRL